MIRDIEKRRECRRRYYAKRRESNIRYSSEWNRSNPEKRKATLRRYWLKNSKRLLQIRRDKTANLTEEDRIKRRRQKREWFEKNPNYAKQWNEKNADRVRESKRRWEQRNYALKRKLYQEYRARIANSMTDDTAEQFYQFVRAKKRVPCYYCGRYISGKKAHIDHVIAVSKRGNHASQNLCASCPKCNLSKGAKLPSQTTFQSQPLLDL